MTQPGDVWAWFALLLGVGILAVASAKDIRSLEVDDKVWIPAIVYGVPFFARSSVPLIAGSAAMQNIVLARIYWFLTLLWAVFGIIIFFTGWMGKADGLAIFAVAMLQPQLGWLIMTLALCASILANVILAYAINLRRIMRDKGYVRGLEKRSIWFRGLLLTVAVRHPAPILPSAGGPVYSERTGEATWLADTSRERRPTEGDWVQLGLPFIPFMFAAYLATAAGAMMTSAEFTWALTTLVGGFFLIVVLVAISQLTGD